MELKDFLSVQKENYNELIEVLSKAIGTNFSYSLKEREKIRKHITMQKIL